MAAIEKHRDDLHETPHVHHGPKKPTYNLIFAILTVLTLIELAAAALPGVLAIIVLIVLMTTKAALVCAYYMHLKYDPPLYTWVFVVPIIMAVAVILSLQGLAGY
ncbi:MAG: cytochrome C oxidase subunit IV family protein [Anaerolineae bacterium]|nr:cytochrome C oxidase subunit IV family protein [Anaerolineae bacterium]